MINFTKSQPAPPCLEVEKNKANGDYKCGDVLNRLSADFHNKCYICEEKAPGSINVEHLVPHQNNQDLKFDWNNLFWACSHCNNTKLAIHNNIINCTDPAVNVVATIRLDIKPFPGEKVAVIPMVEDDDSVRNTAALLNAVYNGTTPLKKMEADGLRNKILTEIIDFQQLLLHYFDKDGLREEEKQTLKSQIRRKLNPQSPFTAFKYWIIKGNEKLQQEFGDLL